MPTSRLRLGFVCVFATVALLAAACGDDTSATDTTDTSSPPETTTTSEAPPETTAAPADASLDASVYFVAEVTEPAAGGVVEAIAGTSRALEPDAGHTEALTALLAGPDTFEAEIGMTTAVPDGTELLGVDVADRIATVDLDATFEAPSGAFTDVLRVAQVVFTLTAFDDVDTVMFAIDGEPRDVIGTHGIDVAGADGNGIGRDDVSEARPPILVETPSPGDDVTDPLVITGEANTFEANVRWAITDPEGEILHEGFTTATAGTGTWGTFEISVPLADAVDRGGLGAIVLWEDSPEDGRQTNVVEIPVAWPAP